MTSNIEGRRWMNRWTVYHSAPRTSDDMQITIMSLGGEFCSVVAVNMQVG